MRRHQTEPGEEKTNQASVCRCSDHRLEFHPVSSTGSERASEGHPTDVKRTSCIRPFNFPPLDFSFISFLLYTLREITSEEVSRNISNTILS